MITVEAFLEPLNNGRNELGHVLANVAGRKEEAHNSTNSRFAPLAYRVNKWKDFSIEELESILATYLPRECEVRWEPYIPSIARVIYGERQLEALYLQTLITRVNIALDKAIPPDEDRVTVIVGPGAFEAVSAEGGVRSIQPDWIVVQGTYDSGMGTFPVFQNLAQEGRILAVGETKMIRHVDSDLALLRTKTCYPDFLRQLQEYCRNIYTRFGFILSNKELIVAQFIREGHHNREIGQRGLRSRTAREELESGLYSDDAGDDTEVDNEDDTEVDNEDDTEVDNEDDTEDDVFGLPPLPVDSRSFDSQFIHSQNNDYQNNDYQNNNCQNNDCQNNDCQNNDCQNNDYQNNNYEFNDHQFHNRHYNDRHFKARPRKRPHPSTSPPSPSPIRKGHPIENRRLSGGSRFPLADTHQEHVPDSSPPKSSSSPAPPASSSPNHSKYTSSPRDVDPGEIKIQNFRMPDGNEEGEDVSPYKVLFLFIMMIRNLKLAGMSINM